MSHTASIRARVTARVRWIGCTAGRFVQLLRSIRFVGRAEDTFFAWSTWFVFCRSLESLPEVPADPRFQFRLATFQDLGGLSEFEVYRSQKDLCVWLRDPETFVVVLALDGDRIAGLNCASRTHPSDPLFSSVVLRPNQAWVRDLYVLPEYRRSHVASRLRVFRNRSLREAGFSETVSTVRADNYPSLKHTYVGELRLVQRLGCLSVFGFQWTWLEPDVRRVLERRLAAPLERGT